ncbi:hypothetical protein Tsubulata_029180 [Turnera subulata]|uniref:RRM domain-containing protein n=1 Tax=Turnera subulata TaxID=218843 RepID=A0A9Q0FLI6_9ROSI|nr:hypothetical protein Tsubulata_029180 [Turnera subulata]
MAEPSKVLHVRNVGHEISENDLLQLVNPFGAVTKLVMLRAKNQALLQMQDVAAAANAIQYYTNIQPSVRGRNVYIQFSSHQELTTADQNAQGRNQDAEPNRILLITIHHMLYPITVDVLHQVFSPYGFVEKIVTFQKSAGQLLQVSKPLFNINHASLLLLPRMHFRRGIFMMDVVNWIFNIQSQYQFNNLLSWYSFVGDLLFIFILFVYLLILACMPLLLFISLNELQVSYNNERSSRGLAMVGACILFNLPEAELTDLGFLLYIVHLSVYLYLGWVSRALQVGNAEAIAAAFGGGLPPGISGTNDRCTVLVSNLNPDKIDEDKLFNLFSLYGNIVRIKLLHSKPDHALVQMGDGFQAELAVHFLKGAMLFGKRLEVNFSKYPNITPSPDTHDYSNSNLNRFNRNAAKNYRYCCSPTKMIHLSTLPQDITEEEIVSHLSLEEHGTIVNTKLFEANGKKQALVLFETEEQATEALVSKHAMSIDGSIVRISFSQLQTI